MSSTTLRSTSPLGVAWPGTSIVNFTSWTSSIANTVIANTVIVKLSSDGSVSLFDGSARQLDIVVDVQGYIPA